MSALRPTQLAAAAALFFAARPARAEERLTITLGSVDDHPSAVCLFDSAERLAAIEDLSGLREMAGGGKALPGIGLTCVCNSSEPSCSRDHQRVTFAGEPQKAREAQQKLVFLQVFARPTKGPRKEFNLSFDGTQVHLIATWTDDLPAVWLTSRSAWYAPGSASVVRREKVLGSFAELHLSARSLTRTISLPELQSEQPEGERAWATLSFTHPEARRSGDVDEHLMVLTRPGGVVSPRLPWNVREALVEVYQQKAAAPAAEYLVRFPAPNTREAVSVRARKISFRWLPNDCLYLPRDLASCPSARVIESGDPCHPSFDEASGACQYTCDAQGDAATFAMPAEVRMGIGRQDDAWVERVVRVNQELHGAPSRETRQLDVEFPWEVRDRRLRGEQPDNHKLVHVDLFTADRKAFRIDIPAKPKRGAALLEPPPVENPATRVTIPGVTCNDRLTYQYWGEYQHFEQAQVTLREGRYVLDPLQKTFRPWWLSGRLSLGFMWSVGGGDAARSRPLGELEAALQRRFYDRRLILEGTVAYTLGARDYVPIAADPKDRSHASVINRYFSGVRVMGGPREDLWLGGSVGWMLAWPLIDSRSALVGDISGAFFTEAAIRYLPARYFNIQASARVILPENVRTFSAAAGSSATFTNQHRVGLIGPILSLGFWLPP